ncbi:MAG: response regulator [Bacteroidia bacterium]|nr:response regulator [Bacteroidia bacterium]
MKPINRIPSHQPKTDISNLFIDTDNFISDLKYVILNQENLNVHFDELASIGFSKLSIHQNRFFDAEKILLNEINDPNAKPEQLVFCTRLICKLYLAVNQKDKAILFVEDRITELEKSGEQNTSFAMQLEKGRMHFQLREYAKSIHIFSSLIENHSKVFSTEQLADLYHWAGSTYLWTEELDVALNYLTAGVKLSKESNSVYKEAQCSLLLSVINLFQNKTSKTTEQLKFTYSNLDSSDATQIEINILSIYACLAFIESDYGKCATYINTAIAVLKKTHNPTKYFLFYKLLNSAYQKLEQFDDAKLAENTCLTLLEENSKIDSGKRSLLNYPAFTVFELAINHALKHSASNTPNNIVDTNTKTIDVLVIDDNKLNLFFTRKILSNKGYQTHIASKITEVKNILKNNSVDVILLDIQMPVMNGYEMFENLVNEGLVTKGKPQVVAMTGYDSAKDKERAYKLGMDDYLTKPFTPEQLNACINNLITQKMEPIENVLQTQNYTYTALLQDKFGFSEVELQKFLEMLSQQFKNTEKLIYESISLKDCNELLQVMHDLKTNVQMIDDNEILDLIAQIKDNIRDTDSLIQHVDKIEKLISTLTHAQRKMRAELQTQFQ